MFKKFIHTFDALIPLFRPSFILWLPGKGFITGLGLIALAIAVCIRDLRLFLRELFR